MGGDNVILPLCRCHLVPPRCQPLDRHWQDSWVSGHHPAATQFYRLIQNGLFSDKNGKTKSVSRPLNAVSNHPRFPTHLRHISGPSLHQHSSFLEKSKSFDTQPLQFAGESCYVVKQKDRVGRVGIFPCPCPQVPRARQNTMKSVEGADLDISFTTVKNNVHKHHIEC